MPEENKNLPNSGDSSQAPNLESPRDLTPHEDIEGLRKIAEEVLKEYKPTLERTLISRWAGEEKQPRAPQGSSVEEPPAEDGKKRMLPQEKETITRQQRFEAYAPPPSAPPPETPTPPAELEPEEIAPAENRILRLASNILIVFLVVGGAAVAGYWYTNRSIRHEPKVPELPVSDGLEPPPEATVPAMPPSPPTEPEEIKPVTSWSRLKNKTLGFTLDYPQDWSIYPDDFANTAESIFISSKPLSSVPTSIQELEVGSFDLLVEIGLLSQDKEPQISLEEYLSADPELYNTASFDFPPLAGKAAVREQKQDGSQINYYVDKDIFIFFISIKPRDYHSAYREVTEKILGSFNFFEPVEIELTKEYTNTIDNYSLKYPENWKDAGLSSSEIGLFKNFAEEDEKVKLAIGTLKSANLESFVGEVADETYFTYLKDQELGVERTTDARYKVTKLGERTIGGEIAIKQKETAVGELNVVYYVWHNSALLRISANFSDEGTWLNYEETVEAILDTLQFTSRSS